MRFIDLCLKLADNFLIFKKPNKKRLKFKKIVLYRLRDFKINELVHFLILAVFDEFQSRAMIATVHRLSYSHFFRAIFAYRCRVEHS